MTTEPTGIAKRVGATAVYPGPDHLTGRCLIGSCEFVCHGPTPRQTRRLMERHHKDAHGR